MKGIMFKEELFHKVITGEKTETRRIVKVDNPDWLADAPPLMAKPRYRPGEVVYLKEPFHHWLREDILFYAYGMDESDRKKTKWENKMFMPSSAARYFIRITSVHAERLQDITAGSIRREGVDPVSGIGGQTYNVDPERVNWISLWNSINKPPYAWEDNPWVWVYRFELTTKPEQQ